MKKKIIAVVTVLSMLLYSMSVFASGNTTMPINDPDLTRNTKPYNVYWGSVSAPVGVKAGSTFAIQLYLTNTGLNTWSASDTHVSYHWLDSSGNIYIWDGKRAILQNDVLHGSPTQVTLNITAPSLPGTYTLQLDMVKEAVTWFSQAGGATYNTKITVRDVSKQNNSNDTSLTPVPDSTIQSRNWLNYTPAQGNGVSGAAIIQDNGTDTSKSRQWVHGGGYTTVSKQVPVTSTTWVQSQEWVPPVTHQEWVPPVTHQVWLPPVTHQVWVQPPGYWGWVWIPPYIDHWEYVITGSDGNGNPLWSWIAVQHPGYYSWQWIQPSGYWETVVEQPGHYETVVDQPGYYQTIVDQPGYWADTSHWETTTTYETVQDTQYTNSSHWTDYSTIIPQYQLNN